MQYVLFKDMTIYLYWPYLYLENSYSKILQEIPEKTHVKLAFWVVLQIDQNNNYTVFIDCSCWNVKPGVRSDV